MGIVTLEDILEEIVGDIWDEHDEVEEEVTMLDEHTYTVDGAMTLEDFDEQFDISVESDSVSLGGWIAEQLGKIPDEGDELEYENLKIKVTATENHRATFIELTLCEVEDVEESAKM
jgi:CBS domain containing-hemolysin-like protein